MRARGSPYSPNCGAHPRSRTLPGDLLTAATSRPASTPLFDDSRPAAPPPPSGLRRRPPIQDEPLPAPQTPPLRLDDSAPVRSQSEYGSTRAASLLAISLLSR